jgi:CMD domain protein
MTDRDVINLLAGVELDSSVHPLRERRADARLNAQKSYETLFKPASASGVAVQERHAVAAFVAGLHRNSEALAFYKSGLDVQNGAGVGEAIDQEIARAAAVGPYGRYPEGRLSVEDRTGPTFRVSESNPERLGVRLVAALEHAHRLVFHPRDASPAALETLRDAGWSTTDVVTLSQLVAFLTCQIASSQACAR